jgi:hypothetical protein
MKLNQLLLGVCLLISTVSFSQPVANMVAYAGNAGREGFKDIVQLSNGTFLISGFASNLNWIPAAVPRTQLSGTGINNAAGTNVFGILLQLDNNLQNILQVLHFPQGKVEAIDFIKTTGQPGQPSDAIYISATTNDTKANNGGYIIARLNNNFVNGVPTDVAWSFAVWAEGYVKDSHPWDVGNDGKVVYITGQSHAADWACMHRLTASGTRDVVPEWRTHWRTAVAGGGEYKGILADFTGSLSDIDYSGCVLKVAGRCDLRSTTHTDFTFWQPDENGGTKRGKWPLDFLFGNPCNVASVSTSGPGYNKYRLGGSAVPGAQCVAIDRRNNHIYMGLNIKTVLPDNNPDFEPTVMAFNQNGGLRWFSRLYHEVQPDGDTVQSSPDQYVDAIAIDYTQPAASGTLLVNGRAHGNNVENLWEGNSVAANPSANGFKNGFSGTSGNIHISWLGRFNTSNGQLRASTYVAELGEGATTGLGTPHPDPNMDGWPNPNTGWQTLNSTYLRKNGLKVAANGHVLVLGKGRRTLTTANAYQKMPLPTSTEKGTWNDFVRLYTPDLSKPLYSSLVTGNWDKTTGSGGDNIELAGAVKINTGVVVVGTHKASAGVSMGNPLATIAPPTWGHGNSIAPANEEAVLAFLTAANINDATTIPVKLLYLTAQRQGQQLVCEWQTGFEQGLSHYVVLVSRDGRQFAPMATVAATNRPSGSRYQQHLSGVEHDCYIKVAAINLNGSREESYLVYVPYKDQQSGIQVLTGASEWAIKRVQNTAADMQVIDAQGKRVLSVRAMSNHTPIDHTRLAPGMYYVRIMTDREMVTLPLIKRG